MRYLERSGAPIEEILQLADHIACDLARIAAALDQHALSTVDARDRGAIMRLQRVAHDAALALRRPR